MGEEVGIINDYLDEAYDAYEELHSQGKCPRDSCPFCAIEQYHEEPEENYPCDYCDEGDDSECEYCPQQTP